MIWDDDNLKAIGVKKSTKKYTIRVDEPFTVTTDQDIFFSFRSVLIRNKIKFTETIEEEICKN